eukprot:scaffold113399_cov35-Cyclotella_meneghiniana.AAC.1
MSLCVKYRGSSYNTVEEQQMAVYDSLKTMFDALGRPDIHRKVIENHRFAMVVDTNHLAEYRKVKEIIDNGGEPDPDELKKRGISICMGKNQCTQHEEATQTSTTNDSERRCTYSTSTRKKHIPCQGLV